MRDLFIIALMAFFLLMTGNLPAQPGIELGEFSEPLTSLAPYGENGIALLTKEAGLLLIDAQGKKEAISLPPLAKNAPADFCDLATKGSFVYFCRSQEPKLYLLDLKKFTEGYKTISLKNFPKNRQVVKVCVTPFTVLVSDTANMVYSVDEAGGLEALPPKSVAVQAPKDLTVQLMAPSSPAEEGFWKITTNGKHELLSLTSPDKEVPLKLVRIIGFDKKDRLVFLEVLGKSERGNKSILYSAKDGKIVASQTVESLEKIVVVRDHALLGDNSIAFLRPGKSQSFRLLKVTLP